MALDVEYGSFAKQASTGNQTVTMSGSFTPKFIIFYGDGYHTADGIVNDFYGPFRGWTSTTESASWSVSIESNNKNGQGGLYDGCILILDENSATEAKATIVSMSSGQFVINWGTNANTTACRIHYIAIGGADLNDIKIGASSLNTSTGNQSFSSITSFTPKIGFFAAISGLTAFPTDSVGNTGTSLGTAVSSSKRYCVGHGMKGDKGREVFDDTKILAYPVNSDTALDCEVDFVSFDSTGFTVNITNAPTTADEILYVLLGGTNLNVDAGSFTSPTSTGTDATTTTHEPDIVGLETGLTEVGDVYGDKTLQLSYGVGASSTARANHAWTNPDNKTPESASDDAFVIQGYIGAATLTASTEDADIDSFAATSFTLDWTKVSSTAYEYGWWTIGGTVAGAPTGTGTPELQGLAVAATALQSFAGAGTLSAQPQTLSAASEQAMAGAGSLALQSSALVASGVQIMTGVATPTLETAIVTASGTMVVFLVGDGALTLADLALVANAAMVPDGDGDLAIATAVLNALGAKSEPEGVGNLLIEAAVMSGQGLMLPIGEIVLTLEDVILAATGVLPGAVSARTRFSGLRRNVGRLLNA